MQHVYEAALLGLADLLARRAWNEAQDQKYDQVPAADHLKGEGQGCEVGHGSGSREAAAEADQHQHDAAGGHVAVNAAEAGERSCGASREDEEAEGAGHGSGRLGFEDGALTSAGLANQRPVHLVIQFLDGDACSGRHVGRLFR